MSHSLRGWRVSPWSDAGASSAPSATFPDECAAEAQAGGWFAGPREAPDRGHARLLELARAYGGEFTTRQLCRRYGLSYDRTWRGLNALVARGLLSRRAAPVADGDQRYLMHLYTLVSDPETPS